MLLSKSVAIACAAHAGQVDKLGRDYFQAHLTPIAAGAAQFGPVAEAAAWLHDALEDTDTTTLDLLRAGVTQEIVSAIESVSRRDEESYEDLITRSCAHPLGRLVKLVDNAWNILSNPELARVNPEKAQSLLEDRYFPARERLLAAAGFTLESNEIRQLDATLKAQRATGSGTTSTPI